MTDDESFESVSGDFLSDLESQHRSLGTSAADVGGLGELVPSSTSGSNAETEAQAGLEVGLGQTLQQRYAQGVINARPAVRRAAARAQQTGRESKKRKCVRAELGTTMHEEGRVRTNGGNLVEEIWENTMARLSETQDEAAQCNCCSVTRHE